jgi:hypothetical protein
MKKTLTLMLLLTPLILVTSRMAFSIDIKLPNHPPKTVEEREAIEKSAIEIALSDGRVKALIERRGNNYGLQSTAVTHFHIEFIDKENFYYIWDGKLRGIVALQYNDGSSYFVHVDVTEGKVWYIGYIKWNYMHQVTRTPPSNEPLEWINIFYDGRAQNLIDKELSRDIIRELQEVWNVHTILPFNGTIIYPPAS